MYPVGGQLHDFNRVVDHPLLLPVPEVSVFGAIAVSCSQRLANRRDDLRDLPGMARSLHDVIEEIEPPVTLRAEDNQIRLAPRLTEDALPHPEVIRLRTQDQSAAVAVPGESTPQQHATGTGLARPGPPEDGHTAIEEVAHRKNIVVVPLEQRCVQGLAFRLFPSFKEPGLNPRLSPYRA